MPITPCRPCVTFSGSLGILRTASGTFSGWPRTDSSLPPRRLPFRPSSVSPSDPLGTPWTVGILRRCTSGTMSNTSGLRTSTGPSGWTLGGTCN
eukprot:1184010-Prorocentrum_minimum.AAC.5